MTRVNVVEETANRVVELDADPNATIGEIADLAADQLGLPKSEVRVVDGKRQTFFCSLEYLGKQKNRDETLAQLGVPDNGEFGFLPPIEGGLGAH